MPRVSSRRNGKTAHEESTFSLQTRNGFANAIEPWLLKKSQLTDVQVDKLSSALVAHGILITEKVNLVVDSLFDDSIAYGNKSSVGRLIKNDEEMFPVSSYYALVTAGAVSMDALDTLLHILDREFNYIVDAAINASDDYSDDYYCSLIARIRGLLVQVSLRYQELNGMKLTAAGHSSLVSILVAFVRLSVSFPFAFGKQSEVMCTDEPSQTMPKKKKSLEKERRLCVRLASDCIVSLLSYWNTVDTNTIVLVIKDGFSLYSPLTEQQRMFFVPVFRLLLSISLPSSLDPVSYFQFIMSCSVARSICSAPGASKEETSLCSDILVAALRVPVPDGVTSAVAMARLDEMPISNSNMAGQLLKHDVDHLRQLIENTREAYSTEDASGFFLDKSGDDVIDKPVRSQNTDTGAADIDLAMDIGDDEDTEEEIDEEIPSTRQSKRRKTTNIS